MPGDGPFLFLRENSSPFGFWHLPEGGMCVSAFLFVRRGSRILLGRYRDDPRWETLAGLDGPRRRANSEGWTVPASQLKFGEEPRAAARRIGEEILGISGLTYSEPRAESDLYEPKFAPGTLHYDLWFLVDATPPKDWEVHVPPWYADLAWHEPRSTPASAYARSHEDVVARWVAQRPPE